MENKTEIMAQIVALLTQLIDENTNVTTENKSSAPVEMLTIKECTQVVSGLSEHTVRQLVAQKKIYPTYAQVRASVAKFLSARRLCLNIWKVQLDEHI